MTVCRTCLSGGPPRHVPDAGGYGTAPTGDAKVSPPSAMFPELLLGRHYCNIAPEPVAGPITPRCSPPPAPLHASLQAHRPAPSWSAPRSENDSLLSSGPPAQTSRCSPPVPLPRRRRTGRRTSWSAPRSGARACTRARTPEAPNRLPDSSDGSGHLQAQLRVSSNVRTNDWLTRSQMLYIYS